MATCQSLTCEGGEPRSNADIRAKSHSGEAQPRYRELLLVLRRQGVHCGIVRATLVFCSPDPLKTLLLLCCLLDSLQHFHVPSHASCAGGCGVLGPENPKLDC